MTAGSGTGHTDDETPDAAAEEPERLLTPLLAPAEGVPDVVVDERRLVEAGRAIAAGTGPVAVDAERASGHRYGQRAYLVQLRRAGSGTWLIDPVACPDLAPGRGRPSATPSGSCTRRPRTCPASPRSACDPSRCSTPSWGRDWSACPASASAPSVEHFLGLALAKEHSAVDWSTRPLPEPWLRYAALDVEVLVELRDAVAADLEAPGQDRVGARGVRRAARLAGPPVRVDPWRRTSGMHRVRRRRGVAVGPRAVDDPGPHRRAA